MRLTLRTLLAYMDDILEPDDSQVIGKKILESSFATNLLHRIREVTRRLRLGAPNVLDRGAGLDPNTVAEYLDNTLPDAQVPDFEKVCLESDVHLAEVASCHQVLAMVLGEPAEVDPDSRQRMYQVPELAVADDQVAACVPGAASLAAPTQREARKDGAKPKPAATRSPIPDYLREPAADPGQTSRWVAGLAIVILLIVAVLGLTGQFARDGFLAGLFRGDAREPQSGDSMDTPNAPGNAGRNSEESFSEETTREVSPSSEFAPAKPTPEVASKPSFPPSEPLGPGLSPDPSTVGKTPLSDDTMPGPVDPGQGKPAEPQPPPEMDVKPEAGHASPPAPGGPPAIPSPETPAAPPPGPKPPAAEVLVSSQRIGILNSPRDVLLRLNPRTGVWHRLPDQAAVTSVDRLLGLPVYRPVIDLAGKMQIILIDGASLQFLPGGSQGMLGVLVEYGRVLIRAENADSRLRLQIGEQAGVVTFQGSGSVLAIEAVRFENSGGDPETQPGPLVADLYATSGKLLWQENPESKPVALTAPDRITLGPQLPQNRAAPRSPWWISGELAGALDQRAAVVVERGLIPDRPATPELRELAKRPQTEVRMLALRSLALAGDFEPMLTSLDDRDQQKVWPDDINLLRGGVIRSPQSAAQVRTAMEKLYGEEGANLYEMLWKYRPESLRAEEAVQLVDYLDHEKLAFRVLSVWNLRGITGLSLSYKPEDPIQRRQSAVEKWRQRLRSNPTLRSRPPGGDARPVGEARPENGEPQAPDAPSRNGGPGAAPDVQTPPPANGPQGQGFLDRPVRRR